MLILIKGTPDLDICRDGGSITALYRTIWGNEHLLTLPVKWGKDQDGSLAPIGYGAPKLAKYKITKVINSTGKPYTKSATTENEISIRQAFNIAKKILKSVQGTNQEDMASVLAREIGRQCRELS